MALTAAPTFAPAPLFSSTARITVALAKAGARLTSMSKVSLTVPPLLSSAVTLTDSVPALAASGVPAKVREEAVNISHPGSAVSSDCVAV